MLIAFQFYSRPCLLHACVLTGVHDCIRTCLHACMSTRSHACMLTCLHAYMHVGLCAYVIICLVTKISKRWHNYLHVYLYSYTIIMFHRGTLQYISVYTCKYVYLIAYSTIYLNILGMGLFVISVLSLLCLALFLLPFAFVRKSSKNRHVQILLLSK